MSVITDRKPYWHKICYYLGTTFPINNVLVFFNLIYKKQYNILK